MNEQKINILRNFGASLCQIGQGFIKKSFKLSPKLYYWHDLEKFLKEQLKGVRLNPKDGKYFLIDWETMKKIIAVDWIDKKKYVKERFDCEVPVELAWAWGLFFADGSCGLRKKGGYSGAYWRIVNTNKDFLERAKRALDWEYKDILTFKIVLYSSYKKGVETNYGKRTKDTYCLEVIPKRKGKRLLTGHHKYSNGGRKVRGKFIELYQELFYDYGKKIVPKPIFDKYHKPRKTFLEGVIAGDGSKTGSGNCRFISVGRKNPRAMMELDWHMFALGLKHRIVNYEREFRIYYSKKFEINPIPVFCDDFAYSFFTHTSEIFEINNVGIVHGHIYNKDTGKWIGGHFWNAILTENYGELHIHFYEPMNDKFVLNIKGKKVIMGNWEYRALSIRF